MGDSKKTAPCVYSRDNDKCQDEKLLQPFTYIMQTPGKNIRSKLARAFNYWLNISEEKLKAIEEIVEMMHNASLLLDDIQDNSILRRGVPVAHSIYGVPSTINAANYVIFIALQRVLELNHPEAVSVYTQQVLELHRGQGMEIYWRDSYTCPTEDEYKQMTIRKTGGLFMLAIRLMQLFSENKADYTKLTGILGLFFQIRDDFLNLYSKDYMLHKSYCEDLTEGKFSFPIIHAIHSQPNDNQVIHILRQRTKDNEVKKYCVSLLEKYGSFDYTKKVLAELKQEAQDEVDKLGENPYMAEVMEYIFKLE
ncbi:terpene synthase [Tribolium castaneum]|uniref:Geranylgeranyl pyrophosphate synthase-like Protein n=1 Tax=Tribolium castaneum TaxID=7070 RepID=D6WD18_TRICA|nr:PREDICTED: geranylgeranyl pyrophosphate synthase [Tribolium castaneum]EEZ99093.1 Geranylgeranyl pyrophosphate synthase-like Protein [Tribolium castaneum]|eukprot:XP_971444.1 PREDICTED: geranylgeranyl pyrophosphate synthase [Tribolium castaneum]